MFDHMESELAKVESKLVESEDRHVRQLAKISPLRRQGVDDTYAKQIAARGILTSLCGKDRDFELAAVSGKTPASSRSLAEQVQELSRIGMCLQRFGVLIISNYEIEINAAKERNHFASCGIPSCLGSRSSTPAKAEP